MEGWDGGGGICAIHRGRCVGLQVHLEGFCIEASGCDGFCNECLGNVS